MPAGTLAQPLSLSTPKTNAQLPFPLFINGNEVSGGTTTATGADVKTFRLRDPGFSGNATLDFTIHDHTGAVAAWIAKQQRVIWYDAVGARYLFQGFVKEIRKRTVASWLDLDVTCAHISEVLDFSQPIATWDAGTTGTSDQAMIGSLLGNFCTEPNVGAGGNIQTLNSSTMPASLPVDRATLRNAIDQVLAATGVTGATWYVDNLGQMHTLASGDISAPYNISDNPNYTTTVPARLEVDDQGGTDVDALYVNGGTTAATGPVYAWQCGITTPPRSPLRWATLDAPQAMTAAAAISAATVEFQTRQQLVSVTAVVSADAAHGGFDGWAKGQSVNVTNTALGWSAKTFIITAVDMRVINGQGQREYTLTLGSDPVIFTARFKYMHAQWKHVAAVGGKLRGKLGGA